MKALAIGFSPGSDAELLAGIPIIREFRRRGHKTFLAIHRTGTFSEIFENILKTEGEAFYFLDNLPVVNFDAFIFDSLPLKKLTPEKRFGFSMVSGLTLHTRDKLRNLALFGGYNLGISPSRLPECFNEIYQGNIPVLGMPVLDLHCNIDESPRRKPYFLYPDSAPFHPENRVGFFRILEKLAIRFPHFEFVIKERFPRGNVFNHLSYLPYRSMGSSNTPENLVFAGAEESTWKLVECSKGLIGVHSGALWQGMLRKKPVAMLADPPFEAFNGTCFSEDEVLGKHGLRILSRDLEGFVRSPETIPFQILKKEVPHIDVSSRIVDLFESIFSVFEKDPRLPWIKYDFSYNGSFDLEIEKLKRDFTGISAGDLKKSFILKSGICSILSELAILQSLINPRVSPMELADFLSGLNLFKVYDEKLRQAATERLRFELGKLRLKCFSKCLDYFYDHNSIKEVFSGRHMFSRANLKYGHYVYEGLKGADRKLAEDYRAGLKEKLLELDPHKTREKVLEDESRNLFRVYFEREWIRIDELKTSGNFSGSITALMRLWNSRGTQNGQRVDIFKRILEIVPENYSKTIASNLLSLLKTDDCESQKLIVKLLHIIDDRFKKEKNYFDSFTVLKEIKRVSNLPSPLKEINNYRLASIYAKTGDYKRAETIFLMIDTGKLPGHFEFGKEYHLGLCMFQRGDLEGSRIHLTRCLTLCPGHEKAGALLAFINSEKANPVFGRFSEESLKGETPLKGGA